MAIDPQKVPRHLAIVLDGNGRWASSRGLSRSKGHKAGAEALDRNLDHILEFQIPAVSLYAFSTENWKRPGAEVGAIWELLNSYFSRRIDYCIEKGIRIKVSGDLKKLPLLSRKAVEKAMKLTAGGSKLVVNFCLNYGSHDEIIHSATKIVRERVELALAGEMRKANRAVTEAEMESHLYTHPLGPVDLMIRPGGEHRLSNFLLWQMAYGEFYVIDTLWPDFERKDLVEALEWYQNRERRFGGLHNESESNG